jgi:hypothetical protein
MRRSEFHALAGAAASVAVFVSASHAQYGDWPAVYDPLQLLALNLDMDPGDWATVQNDDPYDDQEQIEVPAMFWTDGETPILVSVRRKSGDTLQNGTPFAKVSLKIDINEYVIGQSWHGLKKLSLENGDDQDVVSEGLAWQIERFASGTQGYGYQTGNFAWVRVVVNGVYIGVYVNVEQRDKRFLENRNLYTEGETWLYKKSDLGPATLEVGGPQDSPTTEALCFSPFNPDSPCTPDPDLVTATEQWVNVKGLLTLMANDAFQGNGDALLTKGKNFYYADFLTGPKRMYLPWDRDSSLSSNAVNHSVYSGGSEYDALLNVGEFRTQYNRIFNDLICGPWSAESLVAFLDAVEPVLTDALAADPNNQFGTDVAGHFDGLRDLITQRVANVITELEGYQPCPSIQVDLNEFMASNAMFIEDPDEPGEYPDWFELHNPSASEIDLGGLYVTDDATFPTKWQIATGVTIPGNGYLRFWADEDPEQGPLHANLKLSATGEELYVFDTNGVTVIDSIIFGAHVTDVSYGRYPNGAGGWGFMATPTPGAANSIHNAPPSISGTARTPELPTGTDPVWVTSTVTDDFAVISVTLSYEAGAGWVDVAMYDDGAHQDGGAGDDVYGGQIPAFGTGTVVAYYVTATDDLGAVRVDPINAPLLPYSYYVGYAPLPLYINEFMADNDHFIEDPDQPLAYEDWIEVYNAGPSAIDLGGMYLTDDLENPLKYQIPVGVSIAGGSHLVFWADDDIEQGPTHTNFKLGASGEEIGLFDTDAYGNMPIDTLAFGQQFTDTSQGRCPDATANWQLFSLATPGAANGPCGTEQQACCLPGPVCDDLDLLSCLTAGGIAQGAGTACATVTCPECIVDTDCDDGVPCTTDACQETTGVCIYTPFDALCDNGLFCDGPEVCDAGLGCQPGTAPCPGQACDEESDACSGCQGDEDCDDQNDCTDDACVGGTCEYTDNTAPCDDGLFCTLTDACSEGSCLGSGDPCPDSFCDEDGNACVECLISADCTEGLFCVDGTCSDCPAPTVVAEGSRYFAVTPAEGLEQVGLYVKGVDPDVACIEGYVFSDGRLYEDLPYFQPSGPAGWGMVHVHGAQLVAGRTYEFRADCNPDAPGTNQSPPASATLWRWADVDDTGVVDILDVTRILDGFRGLFHTLPCQSDADCSSVLPHYTCDLSVHRCLWITLQNVDIVGAGYHQCSPEKLISITDATVCLDAFRGARDHCRVSCP